MQDCEGGQRFLHVSARMRNPAKCLGTFPAKLERMRLLNSTRGTSVSIEVRSGGQARALL
jgi:hypothetical protein